MEKPEFLQINLRRRLDELGWSYKKFSLESGVSYHTIFRALSKGVIPRGENLGKMANAVGVTVGDLWKDPSVVSRAPNQTVGDLTPEDLIERIRKASGNDIETARLKKENDELRAKLNSLPPEFWPAWQKKAGPRVQAVFLYLLLGGKYLDQVELPDGLKKALKMVRRDVASS